jgi:hypothetical protein
MAHRLTVGFHTSGRAKTNVWLYFRMCMQSLIRYRTLVESLKNLDPIYSNEYRDVSDSIEQEAVEIVVFAGMCLESTLYDLAAALYGETFVDSIDKLSPLEKFIVIVRILDREVPDTSRVTFQSIQALVAARNKLIHHKSISYLENSHDNVMKQATKEHAKLVGGINNSFRALVLISLYFDGNIFEELRILPSFKKPEYWIDVIPKELHGEVQWCIDKIRKEREHRGIPE